MMKKVLYLTMIILSANIIFADQDDERYYWVNGSGVWSDFFNHWSDKSGGNPKVFGKVPDAGDTVFFDDRSFKIGEDTLIVTVDENAECFTLDFSKATKKIIFIKKLSIWLKIFGSLILNENLDFKIEGSIIFEAKSEGNIIQTFGKTLPSLTFRGIGGAWELRGSLKCDQIIHTSGKLITNGFDLDCSQYSGNIAVSGGLNIENSTIKINKIYWTSVGNYQEFKTANSEILMNGSTTVFTSGNFRFHNVTFINTEGLANIHSGKYNKVILNSNSVVNNNIEFDSLKLNPGKIFKFESGKSITVNKDLDCKGTCQSYIMLQSTVDQVSSTIINKGNKIVAEYTILKDIKGDPIGEYSATNSIDLGNITNWQIIGPTPKKLYWVGKGKGYWDDSANWSETNNGSGGACVPTPLDDVYFIDLTAQDTVLTRTSTLFCKSMYWEGTNNNSIFKNESIDLLSLYGSLYLDKDMKYQFTNPIHFLSNESGNIIESNGNKLDHIHFKGISGAWKLNGSLKCNDIIHASGLFNTNGYELECGQYSGNIAKAGGLNIENSTIKINKIYWTSVGNYQEFKTANSEILMNGSSNVFTSGNFTFNNVTFTNPSGTANLISGKYNKVILNSISTLNGNSEFDTLKLSPGKIYTLEANKEIKINKLFDARGNTCFPIFIVSSPQNVPSFIVKESGDVVCDFLSITDIVAKGGANFYAGSYTKSIGNNNAGWIFTNAPNYIYGFGPDTILCKGEILSTFNFNGGSSYLWHDGSTESYHEVDETGLYWVEVKYGDNCVFRDSINIEVISNAFIDAGEDLYVCQANSPKTVDINIKDGISPYKIEWIPSIGVSDPFNSKVSISSSISRQYIIKVESANGCSVYDTLWYYIVEELKPKIIFDGVYLRSNYKKGNQWFIDGELIEGANNDFLLPIINGNYSVIIIDSNGCKSQASEPYYFESKSINKTLIIVDKKEANAGDLVEVNINILNKKLLLNSGVNKIYLNLKFNPTLLAPMDYRPSSVNDKIAVIELDTIYLTSQDDGIIETIFFKAGLGNSDVCDLTLDNVQIIGGKADFSLINGSFKLLGICEEGGKRLINPAKITKLMQISPNPSDGDVNIELNLVEKGNTLLKIFSVSGELIEERIISSQTGNIKIELDTKNYNSGLYFIHLQTPTVNKVEKLIICK